MNSFRATWRKLQKADALLHVVDLFPSGLAKSDSFSNEHFIRNAVTPGPAPGILNKIDHVDGDTSSGSGRTLGGVSLFPQSERLGLEPSQRLAQLIHCAVAKWQFHCSMIISSSSPWNNSSLSYNQISDEHRQKGKQCRALGVTLVPASGAA